MTLRRLGLRGFIRDVLNNEHSRWYFVVNDIIACIIVVSTIVVILETVPEIFEQYRSVFLWIEYVVVALFSIEYLTRIWIAERPTRYITSPFGIIDLLAILPSLLAFALPFAFPYHALGVLRILRILRILRAFRLARFVVSTKRRREIVRNMAQGVALFNIEIYLFALLSIIIISGSLLYVFESTIPGSPFTSIPAGMWWSVVTITTVGYGDLVPVTIYGRIIAGFTMLSGLVMFALLVAVMGRTMQTMLFGSPLEDNRR